MARARAIRLLGQDLYHLRPAFISLLLFMFQFIGPSRTLTMLRPLHRRDAVRPSVEGTAGYWPYRYAPSADAQHHPPPPEQVRPPKPVGECMVPAPLLEYALLDKVSPTPEPVLDPTAVRRPRQLCDVPPVDHVKAPDIKRELGLLSLNPQTPAYIMGYRYHLVVPRHRNEYTNMRADNRADSAECQCM